MDNKLLLGSMILEKLIQYANDFAFSGNLRDSIALIVAADNTVKIVIRAPKYNVAKYKRTGIIEHHTGKRAGSYAQAVNNWGEHKGWVQKAYVEAVEQFASLHKGVVEHE